MSQVHNKNSFYTRGLCARLLPHSLKSIQVILNNDQEYVFVNQNRGIIILYYKSRTITSWQYNNSSNTVNAQAAGLKTHTNRIRILNIIFAVLY